MVRKVMRSGYSASSVRSPVSQPPFTNCTMPTLKPWPRQRMTMPNAAVDFPLPLPVWTMSRPFSMVLVAMIFARAALRLAAFSSARWLRSSAVRLCSSIIVSLRSRVRGRLHVDQLELIDALAEQLAEGRLHYVKLIQCSRHCVVAESFGFGFLQALQIPDW